MSITERDYINGLLEDLVLLCEIRNELGPAANAKTEARIAAIEAELRKFEYDVNGEF